jgi:hypothetical protein
VEGFERVMEIQVKISDRLEQLMECIYDEYDRDSVFKQYGEFASILIERSRINFGDAGAQIDAIRHLRDLGWIVVVPLGRRESTELNILSRIKPTHLGLRHVEMRRRPWLKRYWRTIYESTVAGIVRGLRK